MTDAPLVPLDALRVHHAPHCAPRIACLVPSITETLFALGLGDHVVARTGFCIHPDAAVRAVPKVGGTKDVNLAKLLASEPTHVIVNIDENRKPDVDLIARTVPNVIVTHPLAPVDNIALFELLGYTFKRQHEAAKLSRELRESLQAAKAVGVALPPETALYLIWKNPWMTVSRDTYISAMLATVGLHTLPAQTDRRYPEIGENDSVWQAADHVFLSTEPFLFDDSHAKAITAAKTLRRPARLIDGEFLSWYGVRAIAGLRYLAGLRIATVKSVNPSFLLGKE